MVLLVLGLTGYAFSAGFSDLMGHWAEEPIERWATRGLVAGYPGGTFQPNREISRAEFVALVNRAFIKSVDCDVDAGFTDVPAGKWYSVDIAAAKAAGYISGYTDGTFGPNRTITRQEAASVLTRLLKLEPGGNNLSGFHDALAIPAWSRGSLAAVVEKGIMRGMPDGCLYPLKSLTRAEAVVLLDRALQFCALTTGAAGELTADEGVVSGGDNDDGNDNDNDDDNDDGDSGGGSTNPLDPDLKIVKIKGNTVNDNGNILTIVVDGEIEKIHKQIKTLEPFSSVDEVIERLSLEVEGVPAASCSFEDLDRDFNPDVFNVLISKHDLDWNSINESGSIRLTMDYKGRQLIREGGINTDEGCGEHEEEESGCGSGGSGGPGKGEESVVGNVYKNLKIDVLEQEVDLDGNLSIALWGEDGADIYAVSSVRVEGVAPDVIFYKNDVIMLSAHTDSVWGSVYTDRAIEFSFNYYRVPVTVNQPVSITYQPIDTGFVYHTNECSVASEVYNNRLSVSDSVYDSGLFVPSVVEAVYKLKEIRIIDDSNSGHPAGYHIADNDWGLDLINIKGNKVNGQGNMLTLIVNGEVKQIRENIGAMEIRVEGKDADISSCSFEDTDLDFIPDIFNVRVKKQGLWPKIKEDRLITVVLNYNDKQVVLTKPLDTGGGCGGDDQHTGGCSGGSEDCEGGCGEDNHTDNGGCGDDLLLVF